MKITIDDEILELLNQFSSSLGVIGGKAFTEWVNKLPELKFAESDVDASIKIGQALFNAARNEDTFRQELAKLSDAEKKRMRDALLELIPKAAPMLRQALNSVSKTLPHSKGGRRMALTADQAREACQRIMHLQISMDLPEAKARVAKEYKVSRTTIHRIWKLQRKQLLSEPGQPAPTAGRELVSDAAAAIPPASKPTEPI